MYDDKLHPCCKLPQRLCAAEPASLESDPHVDPETAQTICQFRTSCEMVEQVAGQQAIWDHATVHALGIYLQQRAQVLPIGKLTD